MKKTVRAVAFFGCAVTLSIGGSANAGTVAYWRFQDAAPGATATNLSSDFNAAAFNGIAKNTAGGAVNPAFRADVPGTNIFSGIFGGALLNANNTSSLFFTNNSATPVDSQSGGYVEVTNSPTVSYPTNFTVETFVKINRHVRWTPIVGKERERLTSNTGASWVIDMEQDGRVKARFDTQPLYATSPGFNENFYGVNIEDGKWHHVAVTHDDATRLTAIYVDYVKTQSYNTTSNMVYDARSLFMGRGAGDGRCLDGWLDEVRLSDRVLQPSQFLCTDSVSADAQLYWQFDDAQTLPRAATSLVCEAGLSLMNGTAKAINGAVTNPLFSAGIPLASTRKITQGYKGTVVNPTNSGSLFFINAGLPVNSNRAAGGQVTAPGFQQPTNFTAEAFIKVNRHANWMLIVGKSRYSDYPSWSLSLDNVGCVRCRFDTFPDGYVFTGTGADYSAGFNQVFDTGVSVEDGKWHHVACTYETAAKRVKIYVDYALKLTGTTVNPIVYTTGDIMIGNGAGELAFDGWIDEVRLTPRLLATTEFLYTLPPAGTAVLVR